MNEYESTEFVLNHYKKYVDENLSSHEKNLIGSIQASPLKLGDEREICIEAIRKCWDGLPEVPYDIVAWRAGKMKEYDRPYVSATLLKEVSKKYENRTSRKHMIIIKAGSKIFPLRALGVAYGDGEAEIIIDTSCLKNKGIYYEYK